MLCVKIPLINTFASKSVNRPPFEKRGSLKHLFAFANKLLHLAYKSPLFEKRGLGGLEKRGLGGLD